MAFETAPGPMRPMMPHTGAGMIGRLLAGSWIVALVHGTLSLLLGVAAVAWPEATVTVIAVLFGLQLILHGLYRIVQVVAVREATEGARVLYALLGVLSLAIGVLALRDPLHTAGLLALLFGLFWLLGGVIEFVTALSDRARPDRGWSMALGAVSALTGVVVLALPGITLLMLTWILGVWLITWGLVTIALTLWVRRAERHQGPGENTDAA